MNKNCTPASPACTTMSVCRCPKADEQHAGDARTHRGVVLALKSTISDSSSYPFRASNVGKRTFRVLLAGARVRLAELADAQYCRPPC
ncbi:MAG: hypothetical protein ACLTG4_03180 [Oscillospiraceae bacterium]